MKRKKAKTKATSRPGAAAQLVMQGVELHKQDQLDAAAQAYRAALALEPDHPDALNLLGMIVMDQGDPTTAARLIARAVAVNPRMAPYHLNLGNAFAAAGMDAFAVEAYDIAARLEPGNVVARYSLGLHHIRHQRHAEALAALRQVVEVDPGHTRASFLVAGLSGGHSDSVAADYVADLFDSYAATFEEHVVQFLDYRAPHDLAALVAGAGHVPARAWTVLDLGCGTGLCGVAFRDFARHLIGSDLSARMIDIAGKRGVYDELRVEALLATLARARARPVELVVAADVFIYVGALEATFAACAAALAPGGLFAFSTERWDGDGFRLRTTCRYAHADGYIRALASDTGFAVDQAREIVVRTDNKEPIPGFAYLLRREGSDGKCLNEPPPS